MQLDATSRRLPLATCARASALVALLLSSALACTDTQARYDDYIERSADMRNFDASMIEPGDRFDWSGYYLLALSTSLAADQPLLFAVDVEVASDLASIDLQFQPLTTDEDEAPRTPVGDAFGVEDAVYEMDGSFSADLGEVTVPGRANPITGSEIVASVQLMASALASDAGTAYLFCGQASGMVTVPLNVDLAGSTFGALFTDEAHDVEPLLGCP